MKEIYSKFEETELSKIFDNEDFGFRKITVDRPLKLKFEINEETLELFKNSSQYINLAISKKKKEKLKNIEEAEGRKKQEQLIESLSKITKIYLDREEFLKEKSYLMFQMPR
jgi:type I restriction enzyme M protein